MNSKIYTFAIIVFSVGIMIGSLAGCAYCAALLTTYLGVLVAERVGALVAQIRVGRLMRSFA